MTQQRDIDRLLDHWFSDGPSVVSDRIIDVVADRIERQPQRPAWRFGWGRAGRLDSRIAVAGIALLLIVAVVGIAVLGQTPSIVTPIPSSTPTAPADVASPRASARQTPQPTTSPLLSDGAIVFEHNTPNLDIRLESLLPDRRGTELLPSIKGVQEFPAWNPAGTHLAFSGFDSNDAAAREFVWETDATGATPRLISTECTPPACLHEMDAGYSPDGSRIAFVRVSGLRVGSEAGSVIAIRDLQTGSVAELGSTRLAMPGQTHQHPRWSPDGTHITFSVVGWSADDRATGSAVFVVAIDGSGLRRLSPTDVKAGDAEWSPDGSVILFSSEPLQAYWRHSGQGDPSTMHVYTMSPDGTNVRQLDQTGTAGSPSWTAGGSQILYILIPLDSIGTPDIYVMDRDGSDVRLVAKFGDCCRYYQVQQPTP